MTDNFNRTTNINKHRNLSVFSLDIQAYLWLGIPMLLFLGGWMKWYISIPVGILLMWTALSSLRILERKSRENRDQASGCTNRSSYIIIDSTYLWSIAGIFLILVLLGHGCLMHQHHDFIFRNAVMYDLTTHDWPVIYNNDPPRLLCYYFAYWLPAATIAKISGYILPGDIALLFWGFWGMTIGFGYIVSFMGGKAKWWFVPALMLIGFGDTLLFDIFREDLVRLLDIGVLHIESFYMSFNLFNQLEMIFNQTIPLWIALPLLYRLRRNSGMILLPASMLFLYSPLPCVGISVAIAFVLIRGAKKSITLTNASGLLTIAVTGLFFMTNNNAEAIDKNPLTSVSHIAFLGLLFFISTIGIYLPFVWKQASRNIIFIIILTTGMLLPLVALGDSDDLGRRALMPATIMLTYMIMHRLAELRKMKRLQAIIFCSVLITGSYASVKTMAGIYEINRGLMDTRGLIMKNIYLMGRLDNKEFNYCYDNFIAEGDSFYTRYMMRK